MNKINLVRKQESWRPFKVSWEGLEEVGETHLFSPARAWLRVWEKIEIETNKNYTAIWRQKFCCFWKMMSENMKNIIKIIRNTDKGKCLYILLLWVELW